MQYRPKEGELPVIAPELTSELLHCLSTLPDPWPLAKITIDMEKPSQWVAKMCRLFFADEYARCTVGVPTAAQVPDLEPAFKATYARIIEGQVRCITPDFKPKDLQVAWRRPDGSVGMALVLPALTDCRWWFESLLVHSGVSSATPPKGNGRRPKKKGFAGGMERPVHHRICPSMDDFSHVSQPAQGKY